MSRRAAAVLAAIAGLLATPAPRAAAEPALTIAPAKLEAGLKCYGTIGRSAKAPIIFAPGTGSDGGQVQLLGGPAFAFIGHPYCAVTFPDRATADVQVSVQYLVAAIRTTARRAGRPVVVAGVSQGALLARLALTAWPSLRGKVSDVVSVSGTQHGATRAPVCELSGCPPAFWQQARGSRFLEVLNDGRDETPGRTTAWTTVRSSTDEIVRPQTGPHPTSALRGAANLLIQDVCPGRRTTHLATVVDSVTLAVLRDAVTHAGPARASRLPADVCRHPYGSGLDEARTAAFLAVAPDVVARGESTVPTTRAEPPVRAWVGKRAASLGPVSPPRTSGSPGTPVAAASTPAPAPAPSSAPAPPAGPDPPPPVQPGAPAVASFALEYRGFDPLGDSAGADHACTATRAVQGSEPTGPGRHPVLFYLHGSDADWYGNGEGRAVAALAAAEGFVAAAVTYDSWLTGFDPALMAAHARCIFSPDAPGSALDAVCARASADCSRGVVVSGFSQGGAIAALARDQSPLVRAAWVMGVNTPAPAALVAAPTGTRALPDHKLRITVGRGDVSDLGALNLLTGQSCTASPCLRPDGSGYRVVEHAEVADGFADHCFWQSATPAWPYWSCTPEPTFDPGFPPPGTHPWSLRTNLDWLRAQLG